MYTEKNYESDKGEMQKHLNNLREILTSSNATPIRRHTDRGYMCCYCDRQYKEPHQLKRHTLEQHDDETKKKLMEKESIHGLLVKLDITDLNCSLCYTAFADLNDLTEHLIDHGKFIHEDIKPHILPFKFIDDTLKCIMCDSTFFNFKSLQIHMYSHFSNILCGTCGAGFVNRKMVAAHRRSAHNDGPYPCSSCHLVFESIYKRKTHEIQEHQARYLHKCGFCDERFKSFDQKRIHLKKVHDIEKPLLQCNSCDRSFWKKSLLWNHVKKVHLMEKRYECTRCDKAFFFEYQLNCHIIKHTGVKEFKCEICLKRFARQKALRVHVKIHTDDRQHICEYCDAAFIQKCSLKTHLKSKHGIVE